MNDDVEALYKDEWCCYCWRQVEVSESRQRLIEDEIENAFVGNTRKEKRKDDLPVFDIIVQLQLLFISNVNLFFHFVSLSVLPYVASYSK